MTRFRPLLTWFVVAPVLVACDPSPVDVCEHLHDLVKQEAPEQVATNPDFRRGTFISLCVENLEYERTGRSTHEYSRMVHCQMAAKTIEAFVKCSYRSQATEAAPTSSEPSPSSAAAEVQALVRKYRLPRDE